MTRKAGDIFLVLDNIRSAHNVGSIFRTADAVGASKIYLCGITPTPKSAGVKARREIVKTALGAEEYIPWEYHRQIKRVINLLRKQKIFVVALEQAKNSTPVGKFKPKFPLALVVGNEIRGVSQKILKEVDAIISIPMHGRKESLNVAVATGIALFALRKLK